MLHLPATMMLDSHPVLHVDSYRINTSLVNNLLYAPVGFFSCLHGNAVAMISSHVAHPSHVIDPWLRCVALRLG